MNHSKEQLIDFGTREKNILVLLLAIMPENIKNIRSRNKFGDHSTVACYL